MWMMQHSNAVRDTRLPRWGWLSEPPQESAQRPAALCVSRRSMEAALDHLKQELASMRTGRASAGGAEARARRLRCRFR
jgi:hypothetical protein